MAKLLVQNLSFAYKNRKGEPEHSVLKEVSFSLSQGDFVCLCGPNGCGKSTLLNAIQTKGTVLLENETKGTELSTLSAIERAKLIAYMQQTEFSTWDFTVEDFVLQGRYAHSNGGHYTKQDYDIISEILAELGISDFSRRTVHALSGGEFQKVRIARALAQQPKFLLLDEPAASLDFVYEPQLMELLRTLAKEKNIGILAAIHDLNVAYQYAEKIMLLPPKKNVIFGFPDDIMTVENLKVTFGVEFQCKEAKSFQLLQ